MIEQYGLGILVILVFSVLPIFLCFCVCAWLFFGMIKERRQFQQEFEKSKKKWGKL